MTDPVYAEDLKRKEDVLVVAAIDFGSSFSGYAYCLRKEYKDNHQKIYTIHWQTSYNGCPPTYKTPTSILFDRNGNFHSFGYKAEQNYFENIGNKKYEGYRLFNKFKMQLYQEENKSMVHRRISNKMTIRDEQNKPMSALKVFSESIQYLKEECLNTLSTSGLDIKVNDIHWILTVPAIWKDDAKQFMREAATQAGIPDELLTLIYEPEAAAVYCRECSFFNQNSQMKSTGTVESDQQFIVLDCGGGTVDITCHKTMGDTGLCELLCPTGGPWGGNTVNLEYHNLLRKLFGPDVWTSFQKNEQEDAYEFKRSFEAKKSQVVKNSEEWITIQFPPTLLDTICNARPQKIKMKDFLQESSFFHSIIGERGKIRFKNEILAQCFRSSIDQIVDHLRRYLNKVKGVKTIWMVGGFSACDILYSSIKDAFSNLNIIRPMDPMLAIVEGAVMLGNNPSLIRERFCPRTYGICVNAPFDPLVHYAQLQETVEGHEMCTDIFKPIVKKGETIIIGQSTFEVQCYPSHSTDKEATVEVYQSDLPDPLYTFGLDVKKLGEIYIPIPDVERGKGRVVTIQMHFGITELYVTVREEGTTQMNSARFDCLSK